MLTLSFHAYCMTWLFGEICNVIIAWKITRFPPKTFTQVWTNKNSMLLFIWNWVMKMDSEFERVKKKVWKIYIFLCNFVVCLFNLALHWNLSFQPRQFVHFWPFRTVFHPIDSTLQWLLPNPPGINQKRSCPRKSSPEILIIEIHIYNIVKTKNMQMLSAMTKAICNVNSITIHRTLKLGDLTRLWASSKMTMFPCTSTPWAFLD